MDQLRVLGPGRGEGRSFRKKKCGAPWRVPASCPWTLRAVPDWAPPGIPEAPAPTPVWIVLGCQSVAAAQLVRGSHSLGARGSRAPAKRLPRAPLSGNQQPRWQPAASAWLPASRRVAASPGAAKPRLATACRRPTRPFCLQMGGRAVVVASSPALTVET